MMAGGQHNEGSDNDNGHGKTTEGNPRSFKEMLIGLEPNEAKVGPNKMLDRILIY